MSHYYRRHLPHYQPPGATYFVTFRLAGPLPVKVLLRLLDEKRELDSLIRNARNAQQRFELLSRCRQKHFACLDAFLRHQGNGPMWLARGPIARIVVEAIEFRDGDKYDLYAYCVMPNHVHMIFKLPGGSEDAMEDFGGANSTPGGLESSDFPVTDIIGSLKKHTALESNKVLGRHGPFWRGESYDHVVREADELERILWYVVLNPVKARLVTSWADWEWTYCKPGLLVQLAP